MPNINRLRCTIKVRGNLDHLRVNTRNTTYCLAYTDGAFSTSYIDIKKPSQKIPSEKNRHRKKSTLYIPSASPLVCTGTAKTVPCGP